MASCHTRDSGSTHFLTTVRWSPAVAPPSGNGALPVLSDRDTRSPASLWCLGGPLHGRRRAVPADTDGAAASASATVARCSTGVGTYRRVSFEAIDSAGRELREDYWVFDQLMTTAGPLFPADEWPIL